MAHGIFELGIPLADLNADFKVSSLVVNFRRLLVTTFDLMAVCALSRPVCEQSMSPWETTAMFPNKCLPHEAGSGLKLYMI